jgi:hypothetical protein
MLLSKGWKSKSTTWLKIDPMSSQRPRIGQVTSGTHCLPQDSLVGCWMVGFENQFIKTLQENLDQKVVSIEVICIKSMK